MAEHKPWSSEKRTLETPDVSQSIGWAYEVRETHFFAAATYTDFKRLCRGLLSSLRPPVAAFYLAPTATGWEIAQALEGPLHAGADVLVASEQHAELIGELLDSWVMFSEDPSGFTLVTSFGLALAGDQLKGDPGHLFGLAREHSDGLKRAMPTPISAREAATLEFNGEMAGFLNLTTLDK